MTENECACTDCQQMCRQRPCLPTPAEVAFLKIRYPDRLMTVVVPLLLNKFGPVLGYLDVTSPAIKRREGTTVNAYATGECNLFRSNGKYGFGGKCEPLEGRRTRHHISWQDPRGFVLSTWLRGAPSVIDTALDTRK